MGYAPSMLCEALLPKSDGIGVEWRVLSNRMVRLRSCVPVGEGWLPLAHRGQKVSYEQD